MNDPELKQGVDALNGFFTQFGPLDDVYTRVFWEVFLEELYGINSDDVEEEDVSNDYD